MENEIQYEVVCTPTKAFHQQYSADECTGFANGAQAMLDHLAQHVSVFIRSPIELVSNTSFETGKEQFFVQWRVGAMGGKPGKTMVPASAPPGAVFGFEPIKPCHSAAQIHAWVDELASMIAGCTDVFSKEYIRDGLRQHVDSLLVASHIPERWKTK